MNNTELQHYGVLGMKWGHRKATKYEAKARRAKAVGNKDAANKYSMKAKSLHAKHARLSGGKEVYDYSTKQSLGSQVSKSLLMGTYGALKYDQARVRGATKGRAAVEGLLWSMGDVATGNILQYVEPRLN